MRLTIAAFVAIVVGCAEPNDPCREAVDHVAECTHEAADPGGATCDPDRANEILAMDCDQLAAAAAAGKADGWWDTFLCSLGFTSHCSEIGSGSGTTARTLSGNVYK